MNRAWQSSKNILAVRLDAIGDVLMTSPALRALKESGEGRRLTLLTSRAGAELARLIPELDDVWTYEAPWMKATPARSEGITDWLQIRHLQKARFDAAVIFTVFSQNPLPAALLCLLSDIPLRLAHCRENPYQLLTDWVRETEPEQGIRHEVRRQLDLVGTIGCFVKDERLSLCPTESTQRRVGLLLDEVLARMHPWIMIHPGASAPSRRYPPEHYAAVARQLVNQEGYQIVFTGSLQERALVEQIQRAMGTNSLSLAGRLTLEELAAAIGQAPLLITNNSGPAHIAAAMGTPIVDLYALTNPQHTPWQVPHRVLFYDVSCKYCFKSICPKEHHDCLRKVGPERVVAAVQELMKEGSYVHAGN